MVLSIILLQGSISALTNFALVTGNPETNPGQESHFGELRVRGPLGCVLG